MPDKGHKLYFAMLNKGWFRREFTTVELPDLRNTEGVEFVMEKPELTVGHPICTVRCAVAKRFLKTDCDYLMMQDDDIIPLHNPAELVYADKDIIGCPAKVRQGERQMNWVAYVEEKTSGGYAPVDMSRVPGHADLIAVDVVGTGLILIKRRVIEALGPGCFMDVFGPDGERREGTDFAFCNRARKAGFEIYTTPYRVCEHVKEVGLLDIQGYDDSDFVCLDNVKYKMPWGGFAIQQKDWEFIRRAMEENGVKRVLEFGAGLSSLLMSEGASVVSYETDGAWAQKIAEKRLGENALEIVMWDGVSVPPLLAQRGPFDMAFVDGPRGDSVAGREFSFKAAAELGVPLIITHDSGRRGELRWANKYLRDKYDVAGRNGQHQQRCQAWKIKGA